MTILLTGASGFIGSATLTTAIKKNIKIRPVYRSSKDMVSQSNAVLLENQDCFADWTHALEGVDIVIHAAGLTPNIQFKEVDQSAKYKSVNFDATLNLARQAAKVGVSRFVFVSTIKVNGEVTIKGHPFTADHEPAPVDDYAISKAEVEEQLKLLSSQSKMELTIVRSPLIYGQGVKGNFATLLKLVRLGLPLPLGCITHNYRSFICLDNFVDFLLMCSFHPKAGNQTFLISDGEDFSTFEMLNKIGKAMGKNIRFVRIPVWFISIIFFLSGNKDMSRRLVGSLQVDIRKSCDLLGWTPLVSTDEGLKRMFE